MGGELARDVPVTINALRLKLPVKLGKIDHENHSTKIPLNRRGRSVGLAMANDTLARSGNN